MDNNLESIIKNVVIETLKEEVDLTITESDFLIIQSSEDYNHIEYIVSTGYHKELSKYYIEIDYYKKSMDMYIRVYKKICNRSLKILGV